MKILEDKLAEFDNEFVNKRGKSLRTWELNEKAFLNPTLVKSFLTSFYKEILERKVEEMEGMKQEKPIITSPENEAYMFSLAQFNKVAGINSALSSLIEKYKQEINNIIK